MTEQKSEHADPIRIVSAAALVGEDGRIFLARRPLDKALPGLWEFPGGKVEQGETPEQALVRELIEEIGVTVDPAHMTPLTFASEPVAGKHMLLLLYVVHRWTGEPQALEAPDIGWFTLDEMAALAMPPADAPFIPALARYLTER